MQQSPVSVAEDAFGSGGDERRYHICANDAQEETPFLSGMLTAG